MDWSAVLMSVISALISGGVVGIVLNIVIGERIKRKIEHEYKIKYDDFRSQLDKEIEMHKAKIRMLEFIYPKLLEALNELFLFMEDVLPERSHPDEDWYEACEEIALSFDSHKEQLQKLIRRHGALLPESTLRSLHSAENLAEEGAFEVDEKMQVTQTGVNKAEEFYTELGNAVRTLKSHITVYSDEQSNAITRKD